MRQILADKIMQHYKMTCPLCTFKFFTKYVLRFHLKRKHHDEEARYFIEKFE